MRTAAAFAALVAAHALALPARADPTWTPFQQAATADTANCHAGSG